MDEKKLCRCCKKNQAVRSYQKDKKAPSTWEFYCLDCYSRLFLDGGEEGKGTLEVCPYCETALAEVRMGKIVGCAHCYQTMWAGIYPIAQKMQGDRAHRGKTPPIDGEYGDSSALDENATEEYRAALLARARYERQQRELKIIIDKLKAEGDFEGARCYLEKLAAMENRSAVEEDFVWRTRRSLSKQS